MEFLILLPLLFVFLYCLYKLAKDDYVFIRRNLTLEHVFDIAFFVIIFSLIVARFFSLLLHLEKGKNIFVVFFSSQGSLSLVGGLVGGMLGLYLMGKYKKLPFGRLFDFFTLAFLVALPLGFLLQTLFVSKKELLIHGVSVGLYTLLTWLFLQFMYPKLINRTIKEGVLTVLFLMFFSVVSIFISLVASFPSLKTFFTIQNGILAGLFAFSLVLFFKQERSGKSRKR